MGGGGMEEALIRRECLFEGGANSKIYGDRMTIYTTFCLLGVISKEFKTIRNQISQESCPQQVANTVMI